MLRYILGIIAVFVVWRWIRSDAPAVTSDDSAPGAVPPGTPAGPVQTPGGVFPAPTDTHASAHFRWSEVIPGALPWNPEGGLTYEGTLGMALARFGERVRSLNGDPIIMRLVEVSPSTPTAPAVVSASFAPASQNTVERRIALKAAVMEAVAGSPLNDSSVQPDLAITDDRLEGPLTSYGALLSTFAPAGEL